MSQPPRPELDEGAVHPRRFRRDADIGRQRQREAAAGRGALHQRDDRLRTAPHQHHDVGDPALRIQRLGDAGRLLLPGAALHRMFEVEPGAEIRAGALQHHHAGGAVALQAFEIGVERVDQEGSSALRLSGRLSVTRSTPS